MARNINGVSFDGSADITIDALASRGRVPALDNTEQGLHSGIQMYEVYENGYPTNYGNLLHLKGANDLGESELLIGWSRWSGEHAPVYIRSRRDTPTAPWSAWAQVYTSKDTVPGVNAQGNQDTTGNAATATKLQTARNINGVPFDGTKDITLTPKDLDAYSKSEVQSALAGKQPLDNTLTNLSGKDVVGLLAYLGFGDCLLEGSGCFELPGGLLLQWGSGVAHATSTTAQFNRPFNVTPFIVIPHKITTDGRYVTSANYTLTGFSLCGWSGSGVATNIDSYIYLGKVRTSS